MNYKRLWEGLAKINSKYYINSDFGKKITKEQFEVSGYKDFKRLILDDSLLENRNTILDLGCGTGRITEYMADHFKAVFGTDISREMIKQGIERLENIKNIDLIETDGSTLPLPDSSIDIVFSYLVFQHMKNRDMVEKNFKEVYRVLMHNGIFKVRIRTDKVDVNKWWGGVEYTEQSIGKLIKEIGFDILKTEPVKDYGLWIWLKKI